MFGNTLRKVLTSIGAILFALSYVHARNLSVEDRVAAQETIERVYYAHQLGATKSFEQAVPRAVLEGKVRRYLEETAALEAYWKTPVTDEMLQRELERMAHGSRMPERLVELYAALHDDPILIKECLARPILVERLVRNFSAHDESPQAAVRGAADEGWRRQGGLSPERVETVATSRSPLPRPDGGRSFDGAAACAAGDTWDNGILDDLPWARDGHIGIWTGSLMVIYGGRIPGLGPSRGGRYDPATDTWTPTSLQGAPSVGSYPSAIWTGTEMILCGGGSEFSGGRYNPVSDTWTAMSTVGAPSPRSHHTAVWTGSAMVIWGGSASGGTTYVNTGGRYDPTTDTWTATSTSGAPTARAYHSAVWTGNVMVVWGGVNGSTYYNTGGRYDPVANTWTATPIYPIVARAEHSAVWTGQVMVVWGGYSGTAYLATGGRYDPVANTWASLATVSAPAVRSGQTAVWTGSVMVVWGGTNGTANLNTGGRYDPVANTWAATSTAGAPSVRAAHSAVWTGSLMVVWGGNSGSSPLDSGGRYDPVANAWTPTSRLGAPPLRYKEKGVWTGNVLVTWGGIDSATYPAVVNTGGRYDPATDSWSATSTVGAPSGRSTPTVVWTGSVMVVWGGANETAYLNTGGRYDPVADVWTPTSSAGLVQARSGHTAVWTGSEMVIWGGFVGSLLKTGARYDPASDTWAETSTVGAPAPRSGHTAVWTGKEMVVWGGSGSAGASGLNTGGRYDPSTDTWTATSTIGAPDARSAHAAVWTGRQMVIWGGQYFDGVNWHYPTVGGRYDSVSDTWTPTSTTGAPPARVSPPIVWTGREMIVWGNDDYAQDTGGRYDPDTDTWAPVSTQGEPYIATSAVWTGNLMIVWYGGGSAGGRYCADACAVPATWYQDYDGDGYGTTSVQQPACSQPVGFAAGAGDCNDRDASVYAAAPEINDGLDNQCAGNPGSGMIDELSGDGIFAADKTTFSWPSQTNAMGYDVARSTSPVFSIACTAFYSDVPSIADPEEPAPGGAFFYIVRSAAPFVGSWGKTSAGIERSPACP